MEVTTEEAQAVLLEGMEGAQYITIQRTDGEPLSKSVPLLTLNGELISEGMVVDMINAGVGTDYGTATQYYEADDLLQHELTEEDRRLAAALVAVQLQQQQKQQQLHSQSQHEDPTLPDVSHLESLAPVNTYSIQTVPEPSAPQVYPTLQPFKRITHNIKQEFIVKTEYDIDVSAESSEDAAPSSGPKRSLPHKKRIPRKLKQQTKRTSSRKDSNRLNSDAINVQSSGDMQTHAFKCELCNSRFSSQLTFFEHLKVHYEPVKQEIRIAQATNTNIRISVPESVQSPENTVIEEFSEPEDLMEGIRGVVEETGAHIDDDTESQLSAVNNESQIWTITGITEHVHRDHVKPPPVSEQGLHEKEKTDIPQTKKKKKIPRARKPNVEMSCPQCDRSFHHKNSLVYHLRSHSGERPYQCEVCGKSFFTASRLKVHKRLHSGDKPYKCEECGRHFRQWGDLKYHSMSIHSEQRQFQCEYCGKDFARKYSLVVHRRIHTGEKNYLCEYCNKTFRASSYLQIHRRIHTGEKPHPCTVCGKSFRVRSDLKRHMHTHSRERTDRPVNRVISGKNIEDENHKGVQVKTIHDFVKGLKLEVDGTGVMEAVPPDDNPESILPHVGGQTLEYTVTTTSDASQERDPLEAVVRTTDNICINTSSLTKAPMKFNVQSRELELSFYQSMNSQWRNKIMSPK